MANRWENAVRLGFLMIFLALGVTGCGNDSAGGMSVGSERSQVEPESRVEPEAKVKPESRVEPGEVACGRPFQLPAADGLRLVGRFPKSVPARQQMVSGTVEVITEKALRGVAAAAADAFLVRDGRVVTMALPQDAMGVQWKLAAGEKKSVPAIASLLSCEQSGEPLAPGDYELYAQFVFTPDDGAPATASGGPWPLTVK